jgi:hypothetical protein
MKAILKFNLDDSDDVMAHTRCVKSLDMALAMWAFSNRLRKIVDESKDGKYIDEELVSNAWQKSLQEYEIDIDSLIS